MFIDSEKRYIFELKQILLRISLNLQSDLDFESYDISLNI